MKKIFIATFITSSALFTGCSEEFLNVSPVHYQSGENFYKTEEQFNQAVNAAYGPLQALYTGQMWALAEMRSDNTSYHKNYTDGSGFPQEEMDEFRENADNGLATGFFTNSYRGITRCNVILDRIDAASIDPASKDVIAGQTRFLRAFYYFNLVRLFGDVPLVLQEVTSTDEAFEVSKRVPTTEVYAAIQADVAVAIEKLPLAYDAAADKGRATKGAARTLLAKVHMTLKNFPAAVEQLRAVVESNQYDLHGNYADNFSVAYENGIESIFEIQYIEGSTLGEHTNLSYRFAPNGSGTLVNGFALGGGASAGWNIPTQDMLDAYEPGDVRREASVGENFVEASSGNVIPYVKKYVSPHAVRFQTGSNVPVYRYADVLLMLAEALNEVGFVPDGEAFELLNTVRGRAGVAAKSTTDTDPALRVTTQQEFRQAIEHERQVELAFENHRWFDLVRTDRAVEVMQQHAEHERALKSYLNPAAYADIRLLNLYPQRELELLSR